MRNMRKIISIVTSIMLCAAFCVMPVSAADLTTVYGQNDTTAIEDSVNDSSWWTKTTTKLNAVYGGSSNISTVSSGSVLGSNPQVSSVELYCRVSSGSDPFTLYVEDPYGNIYYTTISKSGTITIDDFNGINPYGKWKIWIVTSGTASTATVTIDCYYTY